MPSTRKDKQREKKAKKAEKVSKEELNENVTEQTSTTGELSSDKLTTSSDPTDIESDPNTDKNLNSAVDKCNNCGKIREDGSSIKLCICGKVSYCDVSCQKQNWKVHKKNCPHYMIQEIPGRGKGLIATRKIPPGTLIIDEPPIIVVDRVSQEKMQNDIFEEFEQLSPEDKRAVLEMHDPAFIHSNKQDIGQITMNQFELRAKVLRIFDVNSLDVCEQAELEIKKTSLHRTISRLNHSCAPNVFWSWKKNDLWKTEKEVRAIREIEKGEEIVASYIADGTSFELRTSRRMKLSKKWTFDCECMVCSLHGTDLKKNEETRMLITKYHNQTSQYAKELDITNAFINAVNKLDCMLKIRNEMLLQLPNAFCDCWELGTVLQSQSKWAVHDKMIRSLEFVSSLFDSDSTLDTNVFQKQASGLAKIIGGSCLYNYEKRDEEISTFSMGIEFSDELGGLPGTA